MVTVNICFAWRIAFRAARLLFWCCYLEAEDCLFVLPAVNEKPEGSECSYWSCTKVHVGSILISVGKEKMKAFWLLSWLCFITILTTKGTKYKDWIENGRYLGILVYHMYFIFFFFFFNNWLVWYPYSIVVASFEGMKDERDQEPFERVKCAFSWALLNVVFPIF